MPRSIRCLLPLVTIALLTPAAETTAQIPVGGAHVGGPVGASLAVGVLVTPRGRCVPDDLPFVAVEPGLKGGRASAGYGVARGLGTVVTGRVSFLRTWRVPTPRSYVGAEVQFLPLFAVGARLGAFVPTRAGEPRRVLWIGDFGFGL